MKLTHQAKGDIPAPVQKFIDGFKNKDVDCHVVVHAPEEWLTVKNNKTGHEHKYEFAALVDMLG